MNPQLPLPLRWPAHKRFASFVPGANAAAVAAIERMATDAREAWLFLSGPSGSGRTHLLIAACAAASEAGRSAQYLPLAGLSAPRAAAIRAFGGSDVLAIDDVDAIAADGDAEHALFDLYNRCRAEGAGLLFAAHSVPVQSGFGLPDLVSRLRACTQIALRPLGETERRAALRARADARGIVLDEGVLDWLFARQARDLGTLTTLLDRIDRASLAAQRRVTIPFLRRLLDQGPETA